MRDYDNAHAGVPDSHHRPSRLTPVLTPDADKTRRPDGAAVVSADAAVYSFTRSLYVCDVSVFL